MANMKVKNKMNKALVRKQMSSYNAYKKSFDKSKKEIKPSEVEAILGRDLMRKFKSKMY